VDLFGAFQTEAAIRAGYYPGRIERRYGVSFSIASYMENTTIPWGLASIWAGSNVRYSWKGICGCGSVAPWNDRKSEVFRWQGPDGKTLLLKWYQFLGSGNGWGGYAEAADYASPAGLRNALTLAVTREPGIPATGLFGFGGDAVTSRTTVIEDVAKAWNRSHEAARHAVVSNEIDYFQDLQASRDLELPTLRGGWGNEWDLKPALLAERTAQLRRAVEGLHAAEAFSALLAWQRPEAWPPLQKTLESGMLELFKFYEHNFGGVLAPIPLSYLLQNQRARAQHVEDAVLSVDARAAAAAGLLFQTPPGEDRFVVFNPLGFPRSDAAELPLAEGGGPFVVTDLATGVKVPSQVVSRDGTSFLRILAQDVPSLGWRSYRFAHGQGATLPNAAVVRGNAIESDHYQLVLGPRGQIVSALDKRTGRNLTTAGMNDLGSGSGGVARAEDVGPVSATLRMDVADNPPRRVRVTLLRGVDRVEIDDELLGPRSDVSTYRFQTSLDSPQIRFEEVGAVARPGLGSQGGDFLPGTRCDFMTLNHFASFATPAYTITLSNWDAFAMKIGRSSIQNFDLPTSELSVLALGDVTGSQIHDQGGDAYFRDRFALRGAAGGFSGADAMRMSLAHQNPLRTLALPRGQSGPLRAPVGSLLGVSDPNVVIIAFKPAEDSGAGIVVRAWELGGAPRNFDFDACGLGAVGAFETSLIETDRRPVRVQAGHVQVSMQGQEIKTWRLVPTTQGDSLHPRACQ
jgi:alpha-mannosidase